jgi:hypothetical protein
MTALNSKAQAQWCRLPIKRLGNKEDGTKRKVGQAGIDRLEGL